MFDRLQILSMERRAREITQELEETKDRLLYELSGVDKCTLAKLREIVSDFYNAENKVAEILKSYSEKSTTEFADFKTNIEKIRGDFEKEFIAFCNSYELRHEIKNYAEGCVTAEEEQAKLNIDAHMLEVLSDIDVAKTEMLSEIERVAEIVQTTGDSETAVMSQKAVTDALDKLDSVLFQKKEFFESVEYEIETAYLLNRNTAVPVSMGTQTHYVISAPIPVQTGETYFITGNAQNRYTIYAFYDATDTVIDLYSSEQTSSGTLLTDHEVLVPENAVTLRIACNTQFGGNGVKKKVIERTSNLVQNAGESETKVMSQKAVTDEIVKITNATVDVVHKFVPISFTKEQAYILNKNTAVPTSMGGQPHYIISAPIDVTAGETLKLTGCTHYGHCIYAFYDVDGVAVSMYHSNSGSAQTFLYDHEVTVPTNAVTFRFAYDYDALLMDGYVSRQVFTTIPKRKWAGKKWACVGDSLTEANSRTTKNYHDYIADETNITVVNMGKSGSGYKRKYESSDAFYQRIANVPTDSDVVTIFGSGNDLGAGVELGTPTDTGTETLCGCINTTIDNLIAIMPTVQLGLITPTPWVGYNPATENAMQNYANAIVQICKNRSIPCLDLYHCSNLRPWTEEGRNACYTKDDGNGVHPDETGHKIIASRIKAFLETLII